LLIILHDGISLTNCNGYEGETEESGGRVASGADFLRTGDEYAEGVVFEVGG